MYVDIHVLESVTIFSFSSAWKAVIEIISFHGEEQHTHFVLPKKTGEENRMSSTWQEMLGVQTATYTAAESTQVVQRITWAQQPTEPICPQRGQCWDAAKPDCRLSCIYMGQRESTVTHTFCSCLGLPSPQPRNEGRELKVLGVR